MTPWWRRLKAAVTLGGFWGMMSGTVATACHGILQMLGAGLAPGGLLMTALQFGSAGWIVGTAFSGALIDFEARGLLGRMSAWRIGLWGALMGGVLAPTVVVMTAGPGALAGPALAGLIGLGVAVGSSLSMGTHRMAESVSLELAQGGRIPKQLGTDEDADLATRRQRP